MAFHTSQVLPMMLMGTAIAIAVPQLSMYAQETCPHAILRIETAQYVDQTAVCEAAEPWADNGYQVLVFLTDVRPASEDAWFNILDTVEAEAGLRDLTQADSFERAAIAIEATTATDLPYAVSLTYGEALYNTRLDTDEAALEGIKRSVRDKIAAQDATWGLTTGLEDTAALVGLAAGTGLGNPSSGLGEPSSALPAVGGSGADAGVSITAIQDGAGRLAAGGGLALAGGGTVGALAWRRRRQRQMKAHLATLQSRIANLLMGCEQLLAGGEPDNTVSYQLFVESDGDRYPPLKHQVQTQLAEARQALDQAFQAHAHLQENEDALKRPLVQHVEAWEMLYLAFVGKSDRIRNMSDEELQTLLNPALVLGQSQTQLSQGLTAQLANIQGKIKGTPLKVELKRASAEGVDEQGILGRVEQVDAIISRLQKGAFRGSGGGGVGK